MNDLGLTLAWLAVQVALVLVPAVGLHALASRRGPEAGAWVATWSLGLVVILSVVGFLPRVGLEEEGAGFEASRSSANISTEAPATVPIASNGPVVAIDPSRSATNPGRPLAELRLAWERFGRRAAEPAARVRHWGGALAVVALAGMGLGMIRLMIGLWAVGLCRRRGRRVEDPAMIGLVDELRSSMGVRPLVELREVPDLTTPATAGWRRPMLLLPDDWRTWDESERRAVVAHELAHILRGDYAAGLLARLAVVLNFYHPLVRWQAGRLHLQQELAADSIGSRFAGGRSKYLLALSSLALKQDGRSPSWPARAFLPARGTLIRRIKMLRYETESKNSRRPWSRARRLMTALGLLALTIGVATLRGPARAADEPPSPPPSADPKARPADPREPARPFAVNYISERMTGVVAFRPAAIARRSGMDLLTPLLQDMLIDDISVLARNLKVDTSRPGFVKLRCEDIESVIVGFNVGVPRGNALDADGEKLHSIEFGGLTVRALAPFDWLAFFRQWNIGLKEVREVRGAYYKVEDPKKAGLLMDCGIYLPDDRTVVFESEKWLRELIGRENPSGPTYLRGADWERLSRGLLAVAVNNQAEGFAKKYDLGRPDDAVVLSLFKGVDRWVVGVDDVDAITTHAEVALGDQDASVKLAQTLNTLVKLGQVALDSAPPATEYDRYIAMAKAFLAKLRVEPSGRSISIRAEGFGTFADIAAIVKGEVDEAKVKARAAAAEAEAKSKK